jgi:ketosteroid isomerase-like protein
MLHRVYPRLEFAKVLKGLPAPTPIYFDSVNNERWEEFREVWHPDAEFSAVGARPRNGVDDILDYFHGVFRAWKVHDDQPVRVLPSGDSATIEVHFKGVTLDGREIEFDAVDVFDLEDGRIRRLSNWYDIALVRHLLAGERVRS